MDRQPAEDGADVLDRRHCAAGAAKAVDSIQLSRLEILEPMNKQPASSICSTADGRVTSLSVPATIADHH